MELEDRYPDEAAEAAWAAQEEESLSPEFRQRLIAAVDRSLRVRREILLLAAHASGHLAGAGRGCRECHADWPCETVHRAAAPALEAFADTTPDPALDIFCAPVPETPEKPRMSET